MIYIITGGINTGKTTTMAAIYEKLRRGDGFISRKKAATPDTVDLTPPAARGSFKKPPLDPVKLFIIKFFRLKSTTLAAPPAPEDKGFIGYEILRLATGERKILAYKKSAVPPGWDEIYRCGPYSFSQAALEFAGSIIDDIIARGISPIFIDEIGPLELKGKGFAPLLEKVLAAGVDVYIAVRSQCLADVIKKFNICDYRLIEA